MAKEQTKLKRYEIFAKRKANAYIKSLEFSRIKGRFDGPRVLVNSIPKSGTNLLDRVIYNLPGMRYSGRRTLRKPIYTNFQMEKIIANTSRGEYNLAHIQNDQSILKLIHDLNIKSFIMIRDPRKILVSHYKYVTGIDTNHPAHNYFKNLKNDSERIDALINGVYGIVEPIDFVLSQFEDWLLDERVMTVKFEDLIGEKGGGSKRKQLLTISKIAEFLEIHLNNKELERLSEKVFTTKSPTFRSGKSTGWKDEFNADQISLINERIGKWLSKYGYDNELNIDVEN